MEFRDAARLPCLVQRRPSQLGGRCHEAESRIPHRRIEPRSHLLNLGLVEKVDGRVECPIAFKVVITVAIAIAFKVVINVAIASKTVINGAIAFKVVVTVAIAFKVFGQLHPHCEPEFATAFKVVRTTAEKHCRSPFKVVRRTAESQS